MYWCPEDRTLGVQSPSPRVSTLSRPLQFMFSYKLSQSIIKFNGVPNNSNTYTTMESHLGLYHHSIVSEFASGFVDYERSSLVEQKGIISK